ncbi:hypothetical protein [Saccharopolyspora sp. NPDC050642]|uniref:hypothetical protein n=1 Tax=Saccharopolyspora sp. NPDC050642 TaxID=3157099 RepID=UPI0033FA5F17
MVGQVRGDPVEDAGVAGAAGQEQQRGAVAAFAVVDGSAVEGERSGADGFLLMSVFILVGPQSRVAKLHVDGVSHAPQAQGSL